MILNLRLLYRLFKIKVWAIPGRMIALVFIVSLLLIPIITTESYVIRILSLASIFAIYAASWDLLAGFTGQLNLGHALFFGVAAYTAALLNLHLSLPPWATVPLGGIVAVIVGLDKISPLLHCLSDLPPKGIPLVKLELPVF